MAQKKRARAPGSLQTRWLAGLGLLFVLGTFTILVREWVAGGRPVANINIRIDEILPSSHGYLVNLKIRNSGNATAAALQIEGVLMQGETKVEASLVTVDYVAAGSERDAALFFSNDPRLGQLIVRPKGYIKP
jgi:uncharacterized protein (TIGR02588 family)